MSKLEATVEQREIALELLEELSKRIDKVLDGVFGGLSNGRAVPQRSDAVVQGVLVGLKLMAARPEEFYQLACDAGAVESEDWEDFCGLADQIVDEWREARG